MSISKCTFYKSVEGAACHELHHPWNKSCFMANVEMAVSMIIGTNKFYNIYYLLQLFVKRDQLTKEYLTYLAKNWLRSTMCGTFMGVAWLTTNCIYRNLTGHFNYYVYALVSGTVGGLGILFDAPSRRALCHTTFYSLVLDILLKSLVERRLYKHNVAGETLTFMAVNCLLLYSLASRDDKQTPAWFFIPPPPVTCVTTENNYKMYMQGNILNQQTCLKQLIRDTVKYFCIGMTLQSLPQILTKFAALRKNPQLLLQIPCHKNNIKFATLMSSYVLIYKLTSCWLSHWTHKDSAWHSVPAGFLSGAAYYLQPNMTILFTAVSNLLIIYGKRLKTNGYVPDWPFGELVFALCNGILYHYRVYHPQCCPSFVTNMLDTATSGKSRTAYQSFKKRMQQNDSLLNKPKDNDKQQLDNKKQRGF